MWRTFPFLLHLLHFTFLIFFSSAAKLFAVGDEFFLIHSINLNTSLKVLEITNYVSMDVKLSLSLSYLETTFLLDDFSYFFFFKRFTRIGLKEKSMEIVIFMALICVKLSIGKIDNNPLFTRQMSMTRRFLELSLLSCICHRLNLKSHKFYCVGIFNNFLIENKFNIINLNNQKISSTRSFWKAF